MTKQRQRYIPHRFLAGLPSGAEHELGAGVWPDHLLWQFCLQDLS